MWELTTGCKPFANVEHDVDLIYKIIDGKRPNITDDTPEDFANLMKILILKRDLQQLMFVKFLILGQIWEWMPNILIKLKKIYYKRICVRYKLIVLANSVSK
uniref:Serine-threonine/tyrosine-protein kinase catalytic domain-containing protein n=1 Tax=Rhizophagus irregularis (strain DAOM 181602 / DAOM 197198 / MUCL 43194) TaxID=747089 RepID=U9UD02_RHIID